MLRSDFCKSLLTPGIACGCVMGLGPAGVLGNIIPASNPEENPNETPCSEKIEFAQKWVKRFFEIVDQQLDEETRTKLMQSNGAACAAGAYGAQTDDKPATSEEIDKLITEWQEKMGKENIYREGGTVFFNYVGNSKGLKISDGYCLCPLIENKPETLSATYCQCSAGYVGYMFQKLITHKPVQVELLESLRSGGKACRFKVVL